MVDFVRGGRILVVCVLIFFVLLYILLSRYARDSGHVEMFGEL